MSASKPSDARFKRRKTRHRGITYGVRDGGVLALTKVMGHKNARLTLNSYAHLYEQDRTGDAFRAAMA